MKKHDLSTLTDSLNEWCQDAQKDETSVMREIRVYLSKEPSPYPELDKLSKERSSLNGSDSMLCRKFFHALTMHMKLIGAISESPSEEEKESIISAVGDIYNHRMTMKYGSYPMAGD